MKKRTIHEVCRIIFAVAILNFLLFFLISLFIGGDAFTGKIEDGHYYVGNHGHYTEVSYFVFACSKLHASSVCITHPLAMVASLVYWITGGRRGPWKAVTSTAQQSPSNPALGVLHVVRSSLWKAVDFAEGIFWRLFDSWRKPDIEFFTRLSKKECIATLSQALERYSPFHHTDQPISGSLVGLHFYLYKVPLYTKGWPFLMLFGKLSPTPQGTYVRAWHRFHAFGIWPLVLFVSVLPIIGTQLLGRGILSSRLGFDPIVILCAIVPLFAIVFLALSIWVSSRVGSKTNADLAKFLEYALEDAA